MLQKKLLPCFMLCLTILLSACGFKLRGYGLGDNLPFKSLYLDIPSHSALGNELRRSIRGSKKLQLLDHPEKAEATLRISDEQCQKSILSLNSQGRVREYALYCHVTLQVTDSKHTVLLAPARISLKRDMTYNENQVLAKEGEETLLYRDMRSDIVQQILRRLSAMPPSATSAPAPASVSPSGTP